MLLELIWKDLHQGHGGLGLLPLQLGAELRAELALHAPESRGLFDGRVGLEVLAARGSTLTIAARSLVLALNVGAALVLLVLDPLDFSLLKLQVFYCQL